MNDVFAKRKLNYFLKQCILAFPFNGFCEIRYLIQIFTCMDSERWTGMINEFDLFQIPN